MKLVLLFRVGFILLVCWLRKLKVKLLLWLVFWKVLEFWLGEGKLLGVRDGGWFMFVFVWFNFVFDWFKLGKICVFSWLGLRFRFLSGFMFCLFNVWFIWFMGFICIVGVNWLGGVIVFWENCWLFIVCCNDWFGV